MPKVAAMSALTACSRRVTSFAASQRSPITEIMPSARRRPALCRIVSAKRRRALAASKARSVGPRSIASVSTASAQSAATPASTAQPIMGWKRKQTTT